MAMDMPPQQVEYRIERPAPAADPASARIARAMAAARQSPRQASWAMPDLDASSPTMSSQDRTAVGDIQRMARTGQVSMSGGIPDSYVGERMKLAMAQARLGVDSAPADLRQVRCRMVAMTMDARAGSYVAGGTQGAEAARRAIPQSVLAECRSISGAVRTAAAPQGEGVCTSEKEQRARPVVTRVSYGRQPAAAAQAAAARGRSL